MHVLGHARRQPVQHHYRHPAGPGMRRHQLARAGPTMEACRAASECRPAQTGFLAAMTIGHDPALKPLGLRHCCKPNPAWTLNNPPYCFWARRTASHVNDVADCANENPTACNSGTEQAGYGDGQGRCMPDRMRHHSPDPWRQLLFARGIWPERRHEDPDSCHVVPRSAATIGIRENPFIPERVAKASGSRIKSPPQR